MRCFACNVVLSTPERTRRFEGSGEFVDLCNKCLNTIDDDRYDELNTTAGTDDENEGDDDGTE